MKTKMVLISGLTAALSLASAGALAQNGEVGTGPNPFSDCGIGAAVFPTNGVAAALSNVIWDVGTTAVTSATASPETCSGKNVQAAAFIMESYDNLIEESAQGNGENLATLMSIMDVSEEQREAVTLSLRQEAADVVGSEEYLTLSSQQKAEAFYNGLMKAVSQTG
ncbi:DUF3015 family protein [Marinimicrobium koreense]|uniref:DUF3015 family protein n=1 Tax=Marinimicrobium koreense TaxID=306545 RepID=A0A3N1NGW4_9GAMM|nr:DUF3015 family protein [Marinimicrobium koreense]ROQ17952.1 DUF3015 family protein [Marinimicrobium koreense]